jgi:beta-lactamase class A
MTASSTSAPDPTSEPTDTTEADASDSTFATDYSTISADIAARVEEVGGLVEVVVTLADGTPITEINGYEPMEAASLYKLGIMIELFAERETGDLSFDETIVLDPGYFAEEDSVFSEGDIGMAVSIETLLETMITLSSNVAATALLDRVGNENVNLTMASLGLSSTEIRWMPVHGEPPAEDDEPVIDEPADEDVPEDAPTEEPVEGEDPVDGEPTEEGGDTGAAPVWRALLDDRADQALNVTTAADIATLYLLLVNGQVISESVSQEMLALLENQQINDRLPAYLPDGTVVAHKTGNLDGLIHDAGVIYAPAGPVIVVVLTEDVDEGGAIDLIATIARLAYEASR